MYLGSSHKTAQWRPTRLPGEAYKQSFLIWLMLYFCWAFSPCSLYSLKLSGVPYILDAVQCTVSACPSVLFLLLHLGISTGFVPEMRRSP